jgi:hypothetical protein
VATVLQHPHLSHHRTEHAIQLRLMRIGPGQRLVRLVLVGRVDRCADVDCVPAQVHLVEAVEDEFQTWTAEIEDEWLGGAPRGADNEAQARCRFGLVVGDTEHYVILDLNGTHPLCRAPRGCAARTRLPQGLAPRFGLLSGREVAAAAIHRPLRPPRRSTRHNPRRHRLGLARI